jgi:hypothetical protein
LNPLISERLRNQKLLQSKLRTASDVVAWLGAVQSQDYAGAKWAVAQRVPGLLDSDVDEAFNSGAIVRTHVLRPTWHFVPPADIRWMLALTSPRILAGNRHYCRANGLDDKTLARGRRVLERALSGQRYMTRVALGIVLARAGIEGGGQRLAYLMMDAELQQVVCSGPRQGKQFTYALLDERVPRGRALAGDEALAELTRRYFASHGPATVRDFVWWSGLTVKLARAGLASLGKEVVSGTVDGLTYWSIAASPRSRTVRALTGGPRLYLLPNYDEYLVAHQDRRLTQDPAAPPSAGFAEGFPHQLVIDGILRGAWGRTLGPRAVSVVVKPFRPLSRDERRALDDAVASYCTFLGVPAELAIA